MGASFRSGPDVGRRKVGAKKSHMVFKQTIIPLKPFPSILHNSAFSRFLPNKMTDKMLLPTPGSYAPDYMVKIAHF